MKTLQQRILSRYLEINRHPTLKFMSDDTQIQITRVFRILNGSEMRISEFQKFERSIKRRIWAKGREEEREYFELTKLFAEELPREVIGELMEIMLRKIRLKDIAKGAMVPMKEVADEKKY